MTDSVEIKRQHAWGRLYNAANAVAARIGADGEISTRSPEISTLMDALAEIDGGQWCPGIMPYATALPEPAPPAQPADIVNPISQQEPVAYRHSKTGQLYDSEEEVPLADGDEWAEPLYAAPVAQQEPAAWRQWSTKRHDWDYQTNRGDLRPDTATEPLFLAAAQPAPAAVPPGYALVPDYRGYANLGTGQYLLNISNADDPPELIISIASESEKAGRTVGDLQDNQPGTVIEPEQMAVRLGFATEAGLAALEQHLRILREERFAAAGDKP